MKISLNWIFDHIDGQLDRVNVSELVDAFIKTTAEIEGWRKVTLNVNEFTIGQVTTLTENGMTVYSPEYDKEYHLPKRIDATINSWFMIYTPQTTPEWATSTHFGGIKEMILPALYACQEIQTGKWKTIIEKEDYIIEVDNKSINSRPDLWGHRGLAREIAAILTMPLRSLDEYIVPKESEVLAKHSPEQITTEHSYNEERNIFSIAIKAPNSCSRFATLYFPSITPHASDLHMLIRLSRLDSRSINFLVDATNYIMLDLGQPMHAFDAHAINTKQLVVNYAQEGDKLALLDGETIELTSQDLVICDDKKPISLAGIMGGESTAITHNTASILLEAAHFDPVLIRRTAARHKKRTESSMRFEKNIDPCGNVNALKRFLFLLDKMGISYTADEKIVSLGSDFEQKVLTVKHDFIEQRLGVLIKPEKIVDILDKLEFGVEQSAEDSSVMYMIKIPSFRATKDIKIPEDIVEEVGRSIGYDTIPRVMPSLQLHAHDLHTTYTTRTIKQFLSHGLQMRELYGYSFFDESMLRQLTWQPTHCIDIKNPISENYTRLVTTLQPHLLKAIKDNSIAHTQLRFYEWGRVWHTKNENIIEQKSLSGIFFDASLPIDFYTGKSLLSRLFEQLHIHISWQPQQENSFPWYSSHQTATLIHEGIEIGTAGIVSESIVNILSPAGGSIFIFEVNADYLVTYRKPLQRFNPLSKYQAVQRDVSILIPLSIAADVVIDVIKSSDARITKISLIDFFTKTEWENQKSMTFRVDIEDKEKTLTSQEIDELWSIVLDQLKLQGAVIR